MSLVVTVILIATCFRYRQILKRENTRDAGKFQNNAVYEGDRQRDTPPQCALQMVIMMSHHNPSPQVQVNFQLRFRYLTVQVQYV